MLQMEHYKDRLIFFVKVSQALGVFLFQKNGWEQEKEKTKISGGEIPQRRQNKLGEMISSAAHFKQKIVLLGASEREPRVWCLSCALARRHCKPAELFPPLPSPPPMLLPPPPLLFKVPTLPPEWHSLLSAAPVSRPSNGEIRLLSPPRVKIWPQSRGTNGAAKPLSRHLRWTKGNNAPCDRKY